MKYFVVTHRPLEWPLPDFMEPVSTVPVGDGVADLSEDHTNLRGRGPEWSEYATLFGVRRLLQATWAASGLPSEDEMLGVAHYRRFPVTRPLGTTSDVYGVLRTDEFIRLSDDVFLPPPGTLLLPSGADRGMSVLSQYARSHVARDLMHFMGIAIDLGVVDDRAVAGYLSQNTMVAAPSIGVYPAAWYVHVLHELERVVDAFEAGVAVRREGYQSRTVGFCCERLHSMLLLQLLEGWPGDRVTVNPAVIVSDDGTYAPSS